MSHAPDRSKSVVALADERSLDAIPANLLFQNFDAVNKALSLSLEHFGSIGVRGRWFINSHPKSGTHLLRNILLHFNTPQIYKDILFYDTVEPALRQPEPDQIYMGHVPYATYADCPKGAMRSVLLVRHPGAIALALARAFYDRNSMRPDHVYMREHDSFEEIVRKVVSGYECQGQEFGSLIASLTEFCLDWLPNVDFVLRFEDIEAKLRSDDRALVGYFEPLLGQMLEAMPPDTTPRIWAGAAGAISATYSRTAASVYDALRPNDVYTLLPAPVTDSLRRIGDKLGY